MITAESLTRVPLFAAIPHHERACLAARAADVRLRQDEWLLSECQTVGFYALLEGKLAAVKSVGGQQRELLFYEQGDYFGEVPLLLGSPAVTSVKALEPSRVMQLDAWSSMLVFTIATVAFYFLGAAVLHPQGLDPKGPEMIPTLSQMYLQPLEGTALAALRPFTYVGFLVGAWAVLFKTLYVATAANSRMTADFFYHLGFWRTGGHAQRDRSVGRASAVGELAVGVLDGDFVAEESCRVGAGVGDERLVGVEVQREFVAQEPGQRILDGLGFGLRSDEPQDVVVGVAAVPQSPVSGVHRVTRG